MRALDAVLARHAPALRSSARRWLLVTLHRRENLGDKLASICPGCAFLAERGDIDIVFPVHMNPAVQATVRQVLGGMASVHLLPPLEYLPFVALLRRCHLVVTDSGGIQEEAPAWANPCSWRATPPSVPRPSRRVRRAGRHRRRAHRGNGRAPAGRPGPLRSDGQCGESVR